MNNYEALNILNESWSKQILIEKIKRGQNSKKIAHDFVNENKTNIDVLIDLLNQKDNDILIYMEAMANCELNLINELKEKVSKSNITNTENINDVNPIARIYNEFQLSLFMKKWSNQFVIGILIMISIISLTKQAWA
tara:strand:- start:363 stop:773 length:411 start_codon:yes stop_codon:yes gene_type:complete